MGLPSYIYTDGGVIKTNPSPYGGTWCYVWVDHEGNYMKHDSGIITPFKAGIPKITNNYTELLAAINALYSVGKHWSGTLYTDSQVTLGRITGSKSFKGIPQDLKDEAKHLREGGWYKVVLVGGHPTRRDLLRGVNNSGRPVSLWNAFADKECRRLGTEFLEQKREKHENFNST